MDETESMIGGVSDDESSSMKSSEERGVGEDADASSIVTENVEVEQENQNGSSDGELISVGLEDGVDDEEDDEDDDEVMNPVTAASALSDLVGSVRGVVGGSMGGNHHHHHHQHSHHHHHHQQQSQQDSSCSPVDPPTRYLQVEGFDGRRNDIVYCTPLKSILRSSCGGENSSSNHHEESSSTSTESSPSESTEETGTPQLSSPAGPVEAEGKPKVMLFFGGDIQDFPEMMEQHRDHRNYVQFNLEATALQLQKQFPDHHIAVVRPSRIQMLTFSCYDNFVHCNHTGAPEHVITHHSLHHLELLLQNLSKRIASRNEFLAGGEDDEVDSGGEEESGGIISNNKSQLSKSKDGAGTNSEGKSNCNNSDEDSTVSSTTVDESSSSANSSSTSPNKGGGEVSSTPSEGGRQCNNSSTNTNGSNSKSSSKKSKPSAKNVRLDRAWISLVGFSKGCVVLNQLLYEFHYLKTLTPDDLSMDDFLHCIKDMYWLDGGHNGGKNTWITSRSLLETLTRLGVRIHVHLTPYQLLDDRRPWIRKEEKMFSEMLKKFSAPIVRQIHFENEPASLQQHLRIIGDFNEHPMPPQQQHHHHQQHTSLLQHRVSADDDEIDGGVVDGEENHKSVVNVVVGGGGGVVDEEAVNHENDMEH